MEKTRKWRWGVNRWLILLFLILGIFAARAYPPILPHVQLPAETLTGLLFTLPIVGPIYLTNTMVAIFIADVLLVIMALAVRRAIKSGTLVLTGVTGVLEAALEYLYELTASTVGTWAKRVFPWVGTIVLLALVVNWMELIPGVDSIGLIHHAEEGNPVKVLGEVGNLDLITTIKEAPVEAGEPELYTVVPFVRVASTDLNFTVGLALVSFFLIQVFGIWALGPSYFTKFFNVKSLFTKPFFGAIDFAVSLLEIVSEFSKIISFSFRLFGNIFAGSVLLFVIGSLVPILAQTIFLLLEFLIGFMQALVFGMLTMIFISQATIGHGHEADVH
jgi:F-type H+-transporting ATPase subunit a